MKQRLFVILLSLLFFVSSHALSQEIYQWVDDNGVIHYGQQSPQQRTYKPRDDAAPEEAEPEASLQEPSHDTPPFSSGLLWKVETSASRETQPSPSYLFGTIHSDDPRVVRLPTEVQHALSQSDSFCMEILPDTATMLTLMGSMLYTDGQTLEETIGQELFAQLTPLMQRRGISALALTKFKPWVVYMTLSMPQTQTGQFLDLVLHEQAKQQDKSLCGIETAEEQVAVFEQTPLADQLTLLREILRNPEGVEIQLQKMIPLYLRRDLAGLLALSRDMADTTPDERRSIEAFLQRLLDDRNQRMVERMLPRLDKGATFVAVGALHLPGDQGLLQLLTDRGYTVSAVY